jgi:hypothetical protein
MNLLNFNVAPSNLLDSTSNLINQSELLPKFSNFLPGEDLEYASLLNGGKKVKKAPKLKKETKQKKESKQKKEKKESKPKVKLIDTFLKTDLEKIAKKHDVSLKARDGKIKTKEQLFNSLKRKSLI